MGLFVKTNILVACDLEVPREGSAVYRVLKKLGDNDIDVKFIRYRDLHLVFGLLLCRVFKRQKLILMIPGDRLPDRFISFLLRPEKIFAFQHGLRSSRTKKISLQIIKKLPLYLFYSPGLFLFRAYDYFYVYDLSTVRLYRKKINEKTKVRKVDFEESFVNQVKYSSTGCILFIDQPVDNNMLSRREMLKRISLLQHAQGDIRIKFHPRSSIRNNTDMFPEFDGRSVRCAVGFSSSLLFNLRGKMPVFSLLSRKELPAHLADKINYFTELGEVLSLNHDLVLQDESSPNPLANALLRDIGKFYAT